MTQSAITFPLPGSRYKAYNVALNGRTCCVQYSILRKVPSTNTLRAYNTVTTMVITYTYDEKK